ncbi:MAG: hypothetical protein ACK5XN_31630 [Bacteroidota bacterium]|jgi:hypothetical protein
MIQTAIVLESLRRKLIMEAIAQPDPVTTTVVSVNMDRMRVTLAAPLPDAFAWPVMEIQSTDPNINGVLLMLKPTTPGSSVVVLDTAIDINLFPLGPGDTVVISAGPIKDAAEAENVFLISPTTKDYTAPIIVISPLSTTTEQVSASAGRRSKALVSVNFVLQIMCPCNKVETDESDLVTQTTAMQIADIGFAQLTRWLPVFKLTRGMQGVVSTTSTWYGDSVDGSDTGQFAVGVRTEAALLFHQSSFVSS